MSTAQRDSIRANCDVLRQCLNDQSIDDTYEQAYIDAMDAFINIFQQAACDLNMIADQNAANATEPAAPVAYIPPPPAPVPAPAAPPPTS